MRIANRFSIAVHILSLLGTFEGEAQTSEWMAGSIGVNAVVVRNVTGMLRRAGLISTQQGAAGARIARPLEEMTLLDVFKAVETEEKLFSMHENPNPACPIGSRIQTVLEAEFVASQEAMQTRLSRTTMETVMRNLEKKAA
jgi:DNA-binding IscR family transcriptional regulator